MQEAVTAAATVLMALVLLATHAAGVTTTDARGDPAQRLFGEPVHAPAIDILAVEALLAGGELGLRMEVAGVLPVDAVDADGDRRYTYLFVLAPGEGEGSLFDEATLTATCQFHRGMRDFGCEVTAGNATLRAVGLDDRNITARLGVAWSGPLRVGGASHESVPNGTQRDILAQDFTDNALPYQQPPTDEDAPAGPRATPWWKTPWILVVVLAVLLAAAWAWSMRPGAEAKKSKKSKKRR